ncbi:MAG: chromosomal replication initiator protein DnaA [Myxococcales bacterium]|nr:chromosomal replication initiator protein DnaA [Myxococcales bacterium]
MKALWDNALDRIRAQVSGENFSTYFEPLRFARVDGDAVCLTVDDPFFRDWVIEHYREVLEGAMSAVAGRAMSLQLDVAEAPSAPVLELPLPTRAAPVDEPEAFPLNPHYLFDQFVVGPNNEMAHAASRAVAERPARSFNPLFIYGGTGLGKTHLLHAIAHRIKAADPSKRIVYISAEEFTNQVIKSIARQTMDDFRRRFRARCDVLLMDDVHILSGKERTQEEFFHTFNALHGAQKQIVLTSDKTPQEIQHLEERLRSRFNWGLITDIKPPQFETRVAIVQRRAEREGIPLSDEVTFYLARLVSANVRELEGALTRLMAYASFNREPVTIDFAKRALKDILDQRARAVTIDSIQRMVAEHFDVKVADLRGNRRLRTITHPRSIAMYLCRKHTQASFPSIGKGFGGKDHSTVISACKRVEQSLADDQTLRTEIESIERRFSS